ncbi:MAG: response regulator transcription factor [Terracidiphilus sp.]
MRSTVSVLVASPHVMACELMMEALNRHEHMHVVASATTAQETLEAVRSADLDVALICATLANGPLSGFEVLRQLRECAPDVRLVILLESSDRHLLVDAFRAGVRGVFSLSQSSFKLLCRCVEQVHAGQIWASRHELVEVMEAFSQPPQMPVVNANGVRLLTKREEDVVRLLAEGLQNRDIANKLKLSEHTIKNYLFRIFDKLGVSSRVELVLYAMSNRMQVVSLPSDEQSAIQLVGRQGRSKREPEDGCEGVFLGSNALERSGSAYAPANRVLTGTSSLLHPGRVGGHFQDVDMEEDALERCAGDPFGTENSGADRRQLKGAIGKSRRDQSLPRITLQ